MGILDRLRPKEEKIYIDREGMQREYESMSPSEQASVKKNLLEERRELSQTVDRKQKSTLSSRLAAGRERREGERKLYRETFRKQKAKSIQLRAMRDAKRYEHGPLERLDMGVNRILGPPSKQRSSGYSTRNNFNPFGSSFDTGMTPMKHPKSKSKSSKTKYAIVGGKAYPIAGIGKKKKKKSSKKKKRSSSGLGMGGFDMTDNWGFIK